MIFSNNLIFIKITLWAVISQLERQLDSTQRELNLKGIASHAHVINQESGPAEPHDSLPIPISVGLLGEMAGRNREPL